MTRKLKLTRLTALRGIKFWESSTHCEKMTNDFVFCTRNGNRLGRRVVVRDVKGRQKCSPLGGDRCRS